MVSKWPCMNGVRVLHFSKINLPINRAADCCAVRELGLEVGASLGLVKLVFSLQG